MEFELGKKYKFTFTFMDSENTGYFTPEEISDDDTLIGEYIFDRENSIPQRGRFCGIYELTNGRVVLEKIEKMPKSENRCVWW